MTLPGWWLRAWAVRWCEPRTVARLVDPILADLQAEHHEAVTRGSGWLRYLAWARAVVALARVGVVHSMLVRPYQERQHVGRALVAAVACFVAVVAILCAPFALNLYLPLSSLVYFVPYAVPVAIPASLVCGMVMGLGQAQQRLRAWLVALALVASSGSLWCMAVVVPASSQAFQEATQSEPEGWRRPLRGAQEPTFRQRLGFAILRMQPGPVRMFRPEARLALACAPLALTLFLLSVTCGRPRLDAAIGLLVVLGYLGSLRWADLVYESQFAKAWAPNSILLVLAAGSTLLRWQRAKRLVAS